MHDIGHGPYSHALESTLIENFSHEEISLLLMKKMSNEMDGRLQMAIDIFTDDYPKKFLHQLVSSQLDVDRMDYLTRDSFFTGVSEGVIAYDRILKMLTVHNGELMIEEKGIYSIEKFLVSRRLMYWQVYLHKTVLSAEKMLVNVIRRARLLNASAPSEILNVFLNNSYKQDVIEKFLAEFCLLDDYDILSAIKHWMNHNDKILSYLCTSLINRSLLKVKFSATPIPSNLKEKKLNEVCVQLCIDKKEASYIVFTGETESRTYNSIDERIHILFKDETVKDISTVDNALINQTLFDTVKKFYICYKG